MESKQTKTIAVSPNGEVSFIWDDDLSELLDIGVGDIRRASNVEPVDGSWVADMALCGGPKLGPFKLRGDAIAAEVAWLKSERDL